VTESDPIGWRGVVYGTPVAAADGARIGTVREMLGSDAEDIFHGIRVSLSGKKRDVMIPSGDVTALTRDEIRTKLSQAEVYEVATFYHHFEVVKEGETPPPMLTVRVCDSISCELAGAQALLTLLLIPVHCLNAIAPAVAYHDLRLGKEGADVEDLLKAFE
jgi:hypothetical protein